MLISCALFAGSTHAWFSDRCSAYVATVTAAEDFGVNVMKKSESESEPDTKMLPTSGVYHLESGTYTVTLTWVGDEATGGYYKITVGDNVYYSPNPTEAGFSFTLEITLAAGVESVSVTFTPVQSDVAKVEGVTTINSETPISYSAVPQLNAMRAGSVKAAGQGSGESDNGTDDPTQTETNNSAGDNSGSEGEPTGNGNLPEGEPSGSGSLDPETGENAGVGGSSGDVPLTSETNENANGNALENQ